MELSQLEYFKTLAQIRHFTRAANAIALSQPALSRAITKLEAELGVPLFERHGKTIFLTAYGQLFLQHVERALQELDNGRQAVAQLADPNRGTIALSFLHSFGLYLIPRIISEFNKLYPHIQFHLEQTNSVILSQQLLDGSADLVLCASVIVDKNIAWRSLGEEELFAVVPANHRLADRAAIDLYEFKDEPMITLKPRYGIRKITDQLFEQINLTPNITFEGEEISTLAAFVDMNLGVTIIPKTPGLNDLNLVFLHINNPHCSRNLGMAWNRRKYMAPPTVKFQQFLVDFFTNNADLSFTTNAHPANK